MRKGRPRYSKDDVPDVEGYSFHNLLVDTAGQIDENSQKSVIEVFLAENI